MSDFDDYINGEDTRLSRMPNRAYDEIGEYYYTPGKCLEDALARGLGRAHPMVGEIPHLPDTYDLEMLCRKYGFEHELRGKWERIFHDDEPVVWITAPERGDELGHAVFCRGPQRVLAARARGECVICGYVVLDDSQRVAMQELLARYRTPPQRHREGCLATLLAGLLLALWTLCGERGAR